MLAALVLTTNWHVVRLPSETAPPYWRSLVVRGMVAMMNLRGGWGQDVPSGAGFPAPGLSHACTDDRNHGVDHGHAVIGHVGQRVAGIDGVANLRHTADRADDDFLGVLVIQQFLVQNIKNYLIKILIRVQV